MSIVAVVVVIVVATGCVAAAADVVAVVAAVFIVFADFDAFDVGVEITAQQDHYTATQPDSKTTKQQLARCFCCF